MAESSPNPSKATKLIAKPTDADATPGKRDHYDREEAQPWMKPTGSASCRKEEELDRQRGQKQTEQPFQERVRQPPGK